MSQKYMYWTLKKTTYFHNFLGTFLKKKNNDSVENVQLVLLIVLFIYFQGKIEFYFYFFIFIYFRDFTF